LPGGVTTILIGATYWFVSLSKKRVESLATVGFNIWLTFRVAKFELVVNPANMEE